MRRRHFGCSRTNHSAFFRPQRHSSSFLHFLRVCFSSAERKSKDSRPLARQLSHGHFVFTAPILSRCSLRLSLVAAFSRDSQGSRICLISISRIQERRCWRRQLWFFNRL